MARKLYDTAKIKADVLATNAEAAKTETNPFLLMQYRSAGIEAEFMAWMLGEVNRDGDPDEIALAAGTIFGSCIKNFVNGHPEEGRGLILFRVMSALTDVLNQHKPGQFREVETKLADLGEIQGSA